MTDKTIQSKKFKHYLVIGLVTFSMAVITAVIGLGAMVITIGAIICIIAFMQGYKDGPDPIVTPFKFTVSVDQPKKKVSRKNREPQYNEQGGQISGGSNESLSGLYFAIIFIIAVVIWTMAQTSNQ